MLILKYLHFFLLPPSPSLSLIIYFRSLCSCPRLVILVAAAAATCSSDGDLLLQLAVLLGEAIVFAVQALGL